MKKLFLSTIICMVLLIGTISAFEFDNRLTYSNNDLKISLDNWFGLGKNLGVAELKSHPEVNYVKQVGAGSQVVMWYEFDFPERYVDGLGDVIFTKVKTGQVVQREWGYVYLVEEEYQKPIYSCEDILNKNGTLEYKCSQTGTEKQKEVLITHKETGEVKLTAKKLGISSSMVYQQLKWAEKKGHTPQNAVF